MHIIKLCLFLLPPLVAPIILMDFLVVFGFFFFFLFFFFHVVYSKYRKFKKNQRIENHKTVSEDPNKFHNPHIKHGRLADLFSYSTRHLSSFILYKCLSILIIFLPLLHLIFIHISNLILLLL